MHRLDSATLPEAFTKEQRKAFRISDITCVRKSFELESGESSAAFPPGSSIEDLIRSGVTSGQPDNWSPRIFKNVQTKEERSGVDSPVHSRV